MKEVFRNMRIGAVMFMICYLFFAVKPNIEVTKKHELMIRANMDQMQIMVDDCIGHTEELKELRTITDEYRKQIEKLNNTVFGGQVKYK